MIDEKKIKEAAKAYCDAVYGTLKEEPFVAEGFRQGAEWVQQEFVKSLWHDASEEPKEGEDIIIDIGVIEQRRECVLFRYRKRLHSSYLHDKHKRWCYLSDILPKKGGRE